MSGQRQVHALVDLETLSSRPNAALIEIGAVLFDPERLEILGSFQTFVDARSSKAAGGDVLFGTLRWWLRQSLAAQQHQREGQRGAPPEHEALAALTAFLRGSAGPDVRVRVWALGASFDLPILDAAYRRHGLTPAWVYPTHRCARTLLHLLPKEQWLPPEPGLVAHCALPDALRDTRQLLHVARTLKLTLR
ncbi:3'-5' exonuclease [Deinococcus ruber]|uniref:3'-5' exoribonuclease Rv2179c-like domain-containing protein n=1 Tax=Deinococcus ruber TaxID=1848197 RepID=A0A918KWV5_9DEIO|nr:3'-5' exonuclease [Deinococcus ruber]GGR37917.1 hypothetical protein GCM10008957_54020 [Deinococcus ruber]